MDRGKKKDKEWKTAKERDMVMISPNLEEKAVMCEAEDASEHAQTQTLSFVDCSWPLQA